MSKNRLAFLDVIIDLNIFLIIYSVMAMLVYGLTLNLAYAYGVGLFAVPFFILMAVRKYVHNFIGFALIHALLPVLATIMPLELMYKLLLQISTIAIVIYGLSRRLSKTKSEISIGHMLVAVSVNMGMLAANSYFMLGMPDILFICNTITSVICYILYTHISNINYSLEIISSTTIQPIKSILRFNNIVICLFIALVAMISLMSRYMYIDRLIMFIGRILYALLGLVVRLLNKESPQESVVEVDAAVQGDPFWMMMGETYEPGWLWVLLQRIAVFLTWVGSFALIIFAIGYFIYRMYKQFNDTVSVGYDEKEFVTPDIFSEKGGGIGSLFKGFFPRYGNSPSQKIRKIFYKKVKKQMDKGVEIQKSFTAREITEKMNGTEIPELLEMVYEKARYSNEEITKEELQSVEKMM